MNNRHEWNRVKLVPPSGKFYFGSQCAKCKVVKYRFYDYTRFRYPNGAVHDEKTVDEPSCHT